MVPFCQCHSLVAKHMAASSNLVHIPVTEQQGNSAKEHPQDHFNAQISSMGPTCLRVRCNMNMGLSLANYLLAPTGKMSVR